MEAVARGTAHKHPTTSCYEPRPRSIFSRTFSRRSARSKVPSWKKSRAISSARPTSLPAGILSSLYDVSTSNREQPWPLAEKSILHQSPCFVLKVKPIVKFLNLPYARRPNADSGNATTSIAA